MIRAGGHAGGAPPTASRSHDRALLRVAVPCRAGHAPRRRPPRLRLAGGRRSGVVWGVHTHAHDIPRIRCARHAL